MQRNRVRCSLVGLSCAVLVQNLVFLRNYAKKPCTSLQRDGSAAVIWTQGHRAGQGLDARAGSQGGHDLGGETGCWLYEGSTGHAGADGVEGTGCVPVALLPVLRCHVPADPAIGFGFLRNYALFV